MVIPEISPEYVTGKIIDFIEKEVKKSGCTGVVIGLSGGLDSTVVAYLCSRLDDLDVLGISLPVISSNIDAKKIARDIDIRFKEIVLHEILDSISSSIPKDVWRQDKLAKGNLVARTRMSLLYYHSNINNMLVMGTGNKSEWYIGYFTKYGDGAADIRPIGDLYKTQVRQLARYLEVPENIIKKEPTAGLWSGQTDKNEIGMDYNTLDKIIYGVEEGRSINDIAISSDINVDLVKKVLKMHKNTVHKRNMPPICRL
ncbi:NH3-dependent NAD+ synthetase NadE [Methanonatronarchaeum thermophilum]|uniref:NH(3)-dependent NAD(+) synthetase n=1 Tax=Methanonatronarchaeum thermophilum TaxID=1927129 RepID=A0A1Y3GHX7_9EURY|nr:NAD+ synthase [Methanonatronarchaeum thermophilum]OUJ18986.1 NH3-dependent NAD+ synthetase NadE [Methanonatronarchaeum thermophilum]